jgi:hypothetical protein
VTILEDRFPYLGRTLILQKSSRIVSVGTPDLSGRTLNCTSPLPHECGVPPQYPVAPLVPVYKYTEFALPGFANFAILIHGWFYE